MGAVLYLTDGLASCLWGCHGKEHVIENMVGRAESNSRAAFRLIEFGQYDEALSLIRNIAEIANLIWLFYVDPIHIRAWLDLPEKEREKQYSPIKVRLKLESQGSVVPHDEDSYRELCRAAVHPDPRVRPQAHNKNGIPTTGGYFQERAYIDCITRLAWSLASVAGPAAKLAIVSQEIAAMIVVEVASLIDAVTAVPAYAEEVSGSSKRLQDFSALIDETVRKK